MGLLDDEIKSIKDSHIVKPEWALCKYCKVPFLTSEKKKTCERCGHFVQYNIEFTSKIMLCFILVAVLNAIATSFVIIYFSKYTKNFYHLLFITTLLSSFFGSFLWKFIKYLMKN